MAKAVTTLAQRIAAQKQRLADMEKKQTTEARKKALKAELAGLSSPRKPKAK